MSWNFLLYKVPKTWVGKYLPCLLSLQSIKSWSQRWIYLNWIKQIILPKSCIYLFFCASKSFFKTYLIDKYIEFQILWNNKQILTLIYKINIGKVRTLLVWIFVRKICLTKWIRNMPSLKYQKNCTKVKLKTH